MTGKRKAAMRVAAFQFHPLHLAWNGGILILRLQDVHSLTQNPPHLATAGRSLSVNAERSASFCNTNIAGESGLHHVGRRIRSLTLMPKAWLRRAYENRFPVFKWVGVLYLKQSPKSIRDKEQ